MTASVRQPLACVLLSLAVFSGCQCRNTGGVGESLADLRVVWKDAAGSEVRNRDAVYDFGSAFIGERVPLKLVISNDGTARLSLVSLELVEGAPVTIGDKVAPDAAFEVRFAPKVLGANERAEFDMYFTPRLGKDATNPTELFTSKLKLTSEGGRIADNVATITLRGTGEAGACLLPKEIDFGPVPLDETFTLPFELKNPSSINANGLVGAISGADAASFGFGPGAPMGQVAIPAGSSASVPFTFRPTEKRPYAATVRLKGAGDCPEGDVLLKGSGSDSVLSWTPPAIDWGFVAPNIAAPRKVTFTNLSNAPIRLTRVRTSRPSDFAVEPQQGVPPDEFVIAGGGTTEMNVVCRPTDLGGRTATLDFDIPLTTQPAGQVSLKCFGGGPSIKVSPRPTLAFGKVAFFAANPISVQRKVTVQNVGSRPTPPDPTQNLFLGGQPNPTTIIRLDPLNANTAADEFRVNLPANYDLAAGLEAVPGRNVADLTIVLAPTSVGLKEAELTILSNDPVEPEIKIKLTADAQALPPCDLLVTPANLNFGLVTPPQFKDLPVVMTNKNPNDICYVSGVEVAAGSNPAFSIVGGPIATRELMPNESFTVTVRVEPQGAVPSGTVTLTGVLTATIPNPVTPVVSVPLTATMGPVCLVIAPDTLDFGVVRPTCSSATRTFTVYNVCNANVTVTDVLEQAPAGQAPGGPNCPAGGPYCKEFVITQKPNPLPSVLAPGGAPITFRARYVPLDTGSDSGAFAIQAVQNGQNVAYLVSLTGTGDPRGLQTDTFVQDIKPKADILLTVDDSCSMGDKQTALSNNFAAFIQYAQATGTDWQVGVTTTSTDDQECLPGFGCFPGGGAGGKLLPHNGLGGSGAKILTPNTPNVAQVFRQRVNVGTNGGTECGLRESVKALTPPLITNENAGFLRTDANLAVVVVSDAGDQSTEQPFSYWKNRFLNIKGFQKANMFTFNIIGPFDYIPNGTTGCAYDDYTNSATYSLMAADTNGVKTEICDQNWSQKLQDLGKTAFGYRTTFFLNGTPDTTQPIVVTVNGVAPAAADWRFDTITNAVTFVATKTPGPGQSLSVTYTTACF